MRFTSRDLMIDVLPAAKRFNPALILCGEATAGGGGLEGDEEDELECGQATAPDPDGITSAKAGLALLRQQLHQTLPLG
jgi:hypothetical protein